MARPLKETILSMLKRGIQKRNNREQSIATAKAEVTMLPLPARPREAWLISELLREITSEILLLQLVRVL